MTEMQRKTKRVVIILSMDNYHLKRQLIGEIHEAVRVKELNVELMEHLAFTANWILRYCEKNHITPPDLDRLHELIDRSRELVQKMYEPYSSPKNKHPFKTPKDSTEPIIIIKSYVK